MTEISVCTIAKFFKKAYFEQLRVFYKKFNIFEICTAYILNITRQINIKITVFLKKDYCILIYQNFFASIFLFLLIPSYVFFTLSCLFFSVSRDNREKKQLKS